MVTTSRSNHAKTLGLYSVTIKSYLKKFSAADVDEAYEALVQDDTQSNDDTTKKLQRAYEILKNNI